MISFLVMLNNQEASSKSNRNTDSIAYVEVLYSYTENGLEELFYINNLIKKTYHFKSIPLC